MAKVAAAACAAQLARRELMRCHHFRHYAAADAERQMPMILRHSFSPRCHAAHDDATIFTPPPMPLPFAAVCQFAAACLRRPIHVVPPAAIDAAVIHKHASAMLPYAMPNAGARH